MNKKFLLFHFFFLFSLYSLSSLFSLSSPACAFEEDFKDIEAPMDDMESLIPLSDLIVKGHVRTLQADLRKTAVEIQVVKVYKGDPATRLLWLEYRGGKHTIYPDEPTFTSFDKSILFLRKEGERYAIVGGARGKKLMMNDNVYIMPDNRFVSIKIKKYEDILTKTIQAAAAPVAEQKPLT